MHVAFKRSKLIYFLFVIYIFHQHTMISHAHNRFMNERWPILKMVHLYNNFYTNIYMHVHTIFTLQFDDELGKAQARSVRGARGASPPAFCLAPLLFCISGLSSMLGPLMDRAGPCCKIVTLRGWRGRT